MSIAAPVRRRPGPRPNLPEAAPEERSLLEWLRRLRVMTPFQAHGLVDCFHAYNHDTRTGRTGRNTRMRLQRLAREGFLRGALTHPEKGGYSGICYRLAGKGLRVLGIPEEKKLNRPEKVEDDIHALQHAVRDVRRAHEQEKTFRKMTRQVVSAFDVVEAVNFEYVSPKYIHGTSREKALAPASGEPVSRV